jgi:catecholate siderophore receptor
MQAGEGGGGPGGDFLSIRGFNARNDIFIDGVRDFGGYSRDPFNFEQVEVVKGPASAYSGRGSTGGSINLVSKTPKLENSFYHADLGIGTEDYKRFTVDVNQRLTGLWKNRGAAGDPGPVDSKIVVPETAVVAADPYFKASFRLNAMWMESEVANRDFVEYQRWGVAPSLAFGFGDNTKVTLSYFHMEEDNLPDYGLPWVPSTQLVLPRSYWNKPAPVSFSNFYGLLARDYEETVTDMGTLQFEQTVAEWFSLKNTIRYGQTNRDSIVTSPRFIPTATDPDVAINPNLGQARDLTDTIISEQFDMRFSFSTFGVKHELVTGFDLSRLQSENKLRTAAPALPASLYHPNANAPYAGPITYTGAVNESIADDAGLFAFDTMKFWDDKIQLSGDARWDYYESELEQRAANGVTTTFDRIDKVWSYRVALAYKPVKIGTIYVAYGTSFNPSSEGAVSLAPLTAATAALEPEENRTWEIGTKWDLLNERLSVTAAVFRTDKTNARTPGLTPADPPTVLEGEQRVQGFEIGVSGNITEKWKVFGGYTWLESEIRKTNQSFTDPDTGQLVSEVGNELPQTPDHSFSLWTTYALPWQIEIGAGANYVGRRFAGVDNLREAEGYWTFDALISKQFTKNIKAQINVYNLADEEYIDRVSGGHFVPGAGRTAILTVGLAF